MPQISKYKAAGKAAGRYKSVLSDVAATEYAKAHEKWKSERTESMIGEVGASVANILGIYDERKKASEFARYKDIAAELPGVLTEEEEYTTAFGKTKTRTVYKSAISGRVIPESVLSMLGMQEEVSPGTSPYSDVEKIGKALMERIPAETFAQAGVSTKAQYEEALGLGEFTEAELLEMEPTKGELLEKDIAEQEALDLKLSQITRGVEGESSEAIIPEEPYSGIDWDDIEKERLAAVQAEKERRKEQLTIYPRLVDPDVEDVSLLQKEFEEGQPGGVGIDVGMQQSSKAAIREVQPILDQIGRVTTEADLAEHLDSTNEHIKFAAQKRQRELESIAKSLEIAKVRTGEELKIRTDEDLIMESLIEGEEDIFEAGEEPEPEYQYVEGDKQSLGSRPWFDSMVKYFKRRGSPPRFSSESGKAEYNKQLKALAKEAGWTGSSWE